MAAHTQQHSEHHVVPIWLYIVIFGALMVLTVITVLIAKVDLEEFLGHPGPWNVIVALTVAVIKATLVVLFFMHAYWSSRLTQVVIVGAIFWLAIMLVFTGMDYVTRTGWPVTGKSAVSTTVAEH